VSENNEIANEFDSQPEVPIVPTPAEETAPAPAAVAEGVKEALKQKGMAQVMLQPCPCGVAGVNLILDLPERGKVGRATCSACGAWGIDFLAPRTKDQELIGVAAAKAWNEAPRG
jgi:hypothetical protein